MEEGESESPSTEKTIFFWQAGIEDRTCSLVYKVRNCDTLVIIIILKMQLVLVHNIQVCSQKEEENI
jgi:hypothetical protein